MLADDAWRLWRVLVRSSKVAAQAALQAILPNARLLRGLPGKSQVDHNLVPEGTMDYNGITLDNGY